MGNPRNLVSDENISAIPSHLESLYEEATEACSQLSQCKAIAKLLHSFSDVFLKGDSDQGLTSLMKHYISVKAISKPIKQTLRHLGVEKEAEVSKQVHELPKQGLIAPAYGAWSSPVVLLKKKDGS
ncbi:uncharacterized protein [Watersipora subatra]|uniref:uncharacterized protein n=1 Tax=Watersipora subatra TaxID=2589382 RepID=UPI00355C91F2